MNKSQVRSLYTSGHEIGAHTRTHPSLPLLSESEKISEVSGSRTDLINAGFGPVDTFAYPFGDYDVETLGITESAGFVLGRSVTRGYNDGMVEPYELRIQQVDRFQSLDTMRGWIDQAAVSKTWLILMFHQISDHTEAELGITEDNLRALVTHAITAPVDVITVSEGAALLGR
jgi:peptidoglycan/xylan/chitin deacetylase (PgdA/CDA1 family)